MPELCVMDHTGDTKIIWDRSDPASVENAKETFEKFKKKGYLAYSVKKDGEKGSVVREFDIDAERLIFIPPIVGG